MTQHGEEQAIVRGLSKGVKRTLRSAATVALTAGLALAVASASALPLEHAPSIALSSPTATAAGATSLVSPQPPKHHAPHAAAPLAGTSTTTSSSAKAVRDALTGAGAAAPLLALLALGSVVPTPAEKLLRYGTRASRTRGQPDQA